MQMSGVNPSGVITGHPIEVKYDNQGSVTVEKIQVSLKRWIALKSYSPRTKQKFKKEIIATVCEPRGVKAHSSESHYFQFKIPENVDTSNGKFCKVIRIEYFLKFEIFAGMFHNNIKLKVPIEIGSVPINTVKNPWIPDEVPSFRPQVMDATVPVAPTFSIEAFSISPEGMPAPSELNTLDNDLREVELSLEKPRKCRGLYCIIQGSAQVNWSEMTFGKHQHSVSYKSNQIFLNKKIYLFKNKEAEVKELPADSHRYNFSFKLPELLPYTVSSTHGDIIYFVEAVLIIPVPWAFNKKENILFAIAGYEDLNLYPELRLPLNVDHTTVFFMESEPLIITINLPYSGFALGQTMSIKVKFDNKGNVSVIKTEINLKRVISCTSEKPIIKTKKEEQIIASVTTHGVEAKSLACYNCTIEIPKNILISNSRHCKVVRVDYILNFEAHVGMLRNNIKFDVPITIGSVPINDCIDVTIQKPTAPPLESIIAENVLPPSFEEAVKTLQFDSTQ
ncbi:hypothetical protein PVAND_006102 [Polypedilum vanderplanki]|uniref:Arrestin C-terminal-like domain-containing protein n=1 Tax=Polypedilum vanderplanki TaxID=319348 RepID=A0A9J6C3Y7_POLVA|nr:hypothetical protein PVAND_006102 [Polypedilum vanderplanki]